MSAQISKKQQKNIQATKTTDGNAINASIVAQVESQFIGPIPPPSILSGYEDIQHGFADRILEMAEKQSLHRQRQEELSLKYSGRDSLLGIIFAFVICISFIIAGVIVIINVPDGKIAGTVISSIGFGTIVTSFISNTRTTNKDK